MKKRVLSLFLAIALCLTLTPTGALAAEGQPPEQTVTVTQEAETGAGENAPPANPEENSTENAPAAAEKNSADEEPGKEPAAATGRDESKADGSPSDDDAAKVQNQLVMAAAAGPDEPTMMGQNDLLAPADEGQTSANAQNSEGGGIYVPPGSTTEGGGGIYVSEEDTRTEISCTMKPSSIQRGYDGTTDGSTISIDLTFTDGTNTFTLKEKTDFTAKKTFDSADAGWHTVNVEIELIGDAAAKYKLRAGEEKFKIDGYIDKAHPDLTVSLSKAACTVGEKILPLLSVEGAPEGAAVTYYYTQYRSIAGSSEGEGSEAMPAIDESTAISEPGTYYVYAKTGKTKNYEEERSTTAELTVNEAVVEAASVTKEDGTDRGTYESLPAALNAAQDGDTVKLLADHVTDADALNALGEDFTFEQYASIVPVVTKTLTLDLNHKTVDYLEVGFTETNEETQKKETLATGSLTVTGEPAYGRILNLVFMAGALDIQSGEIGGILVDDNGVESPDGGLLCDVNSGTATITGGTVLGLTVLEGAAVTVKNGFNHRGRWSVDSGGTLSITGGTFKDVQFVNSGAIAISGGTFEEISNNDTNTPQPLMLLLAKDCAFVNENNTSDVQDGTKTSLTEVMVKEHTHTFENGKCACGVKAIVTDNNVNYYSTLQAALNAAANDNTITTVTLQQDLAGEEVTFNGSAAGALTLNMNGHKLEATAGVPLTVIGGELIIEGAAEINQNTASNANPFPAISLTGGKLVIAGDLTAQGGYNSSNGRKPAIYATDGELDLQGNVSLNGGLTMLDNAKLTNLLTKGTFYAQDPNGNATKDNVLAVCVQQEDAASDNYNTVLKLIADGYAIYKADDTVKYASTLTLNSDTYSIGAHTCNYTQDEAHGIAYCKCGRSHAHRDLSEEKSVLVSGVCPICGYHCPHKNIGNDGVCTDCKAKMVAKVTVGETTTYTADLADALNKAANGTTITLLADTEISDYVNIYDVNATDADQMVVTLDLAGHTVTSNYKPIVIGADRNGTASHYGTLKIVGAGNITLDYVTLDIREKGVLDLTDWTGESISSVTVTRNGNEEGKLIVGKDAGHIGSLAFFNWPSAEITNTKLYGGSYDEITTTGSGTPSLAGLLPNGYAFKNADGSFAKATESKLFNVTVSACDHGGAEGFDISAATCPYCGAPAVAETALNNGEGGMLWRRFADLQTAIDADRAGSAEFKLLTNVTGDYTINGTQNTALDLKGHSIKGTVTVKGIKGDRITTTLSNTENTTTASIDKVVAYDGAELAGSGFPAVIGTLTLAERATWKTILNGTALGYKVLNADDTYNWYAPNDVSGSQLSNVIINSLPIPSKTLYLKVDGKNQTGSSPKVERGTTVQLCAYCNASDANVSIYIGEIDGNNEPKYSRNKAEYKKIGTTWYYVVDLDANKIGTYDIYFTASKDGYKVTSAHKKLTVTKPNLSNAEITFPDGNVAAFNYATKTGVPTFVVTYKGQTLVEDKDFTITKGGSTYDVGPCTLTIKATDNGDYTGSKSAEWNVRPLKVEASVGDIIKTYDGTTNLPANTTITFKSADSYYTGTTLRLAKGTDYEVLNACYDSANASTDEKTISFTIKLKNEGYVFEDGTKEKAFTLKGSETDKTFKIDKATITSDTQLYQTVFNDLAKIYEINLKQFLDTILPKGGEYGDIQYGTPSVSMYSDYYPVGGATIGDGKLRLSINKAASIKQGDEIGTVTVQVETTNYQPFTLTIHVSAQDKFAPVMDGTISASEITYGQALADSKLTVNGTMQDSTTGNAVNGTFAWTDGTIKPAAGDYTAEWTFTPAEGYEEYATATRTVTVKVVPKSIEGAVITLNQTAFQYDTTEKAPTITEVKLANWSDEITYDIVSGDKATNASDRITLTIQGNGNYTGTATAEWKITPKVVTNPSINVAPCTYNGHEQQPPVELKDGDVVIPKEEYAVSYSDNINAGNNTAAVTITNTPGGNYTVSGGANFTITKAAAPRSDFHPAVTVINDLAKTYEMVLSNDYLPMLSSPCEYGNVSYSLGSTHLTDGYKDTVQVEVVEENGQYKLKLTVPEVDYNEVSSVGMLRLYVSSDNYQDFPLDIGVKAKNKDVPVPDGTISASDITYGQALNDSKIAGKMKAGGKAIDGTFTWTNGTFKPAAGDYTASWTFTPDAPEYATATGIVTVTVNRKAVTVSITPNGGTYGETITPATVKANDVVGEDTPTITLTYTGTANDGTAYADTTPPAKAGTYTIKASITDDNNYTLDANTATAKFTVAKRPATVTPDNQSKVYEEKDPDLTYAVSGVLDGETLKGITLTRTEGENAGEYAITGKADANANPNYDVKFVEGKFTINPKSIDGATVKLGKGLIANGAEQTQTVEKVLLDDKEIPADSYTVAGNTATAPRSHTLTITAKGNYTGTVKQTYVIIPAKAEDAPGAEITIGSGKVKVVVKSEGAVPPAALLTDKAELLAMLVDSGDITADELAQIADGAIMDIVLTVKEANVLDEVKTAMAQAAKGCTIGQYLDISLFKYMTVNGSQQAGVPLHTTRDALTISVVVPDALINTNSAVNRTYCIVRRHDGTISVLDAAFDAANKTLTFKTDRFSDYAIAYKDTAVPGSGSNPSNNNSSNDSETKKNEVAAPTPAPTPASTSKPSTITAMPQTGDTSNPTLYVVLLVASLLGLAVVFVCKKRNDK